jgi:hypothetical protein
VERCVRHRGAYSLSNHFLIGANHAANRYRIFLCPWGYFERWSDDEKLRAADMVKWATGALSSTRMAFDWCGAPDAKLLIPLVLRSAFRQSSKDEHLEDFLPAQVTLDYQASRGRSLGSIAEMLNN